MSRSIVGFALDDRDREKLAAAFRLPSLPAGPVYAVIWTTTPWTLPANQALNVHPEFRVFAGRNRSGTLLLALDLKEASLKRFGVQRKDTEGASDATTTGRSLEMIRFRHPFYDRIAPVYLGEYVTLEQGTGIVHSSPAYGIDDFISCRRYGMADDDMISPVLGDGRFADSLPLFGGLNIWAANPKIVDKLRENRRAVSRREDHPQLHALLAAPDADHLSGDDAMVCRHGRGAGIQWQASRRKRCAARRCGASKPPSFSIVGQVQAAGDDRQSPGLDAVAPAAMGRAHCRSSSTRKRRSCIPIRRHCWSWRRPKVQAGGIEAWFEATHEDFGVDASKYRKLTDTLDVWFDSGSTHQTVMGGPQGAHCTADRIRTRPAFRPTSISKDPTSIAAGFILRC